MSIVVAKDQEIKQRPQIRALDHYRSCLLLSSVVVFVTFQSKFSCPQGFLIAARERNHIEMTGGSRRACRTYLSAENWADDVLFWGDGSGGQCAVSGRDSSEVQRDDFFKELRKPCMQRANRNPGLWSDLR